MIYAFPKSSKLKKHETICVFHNKKNDLFSSIDLKKKWFLGKIQVQEKNNNNNDNDK